MRQTQNVLNSESKTSATIGRPAEVCGSQQAALGNGNGFCRTRSTAARMADTKVCDVDGSNLRGPERMADEGRMGQNRSPAPSEREWPHGLGDTFVLATC